MLREKVSDFALAQNLNLMIPAIQYCTDNAAMIAVTGALKARDGKFDDYRLKPYARVS
jgi:N6-L-threonylcarbamoyladenine synthase